MDPRHLRELALGHELARRRDYHPPPIKAQTEGI
jgi:hypothetical protein